MAIVYALEKSGHDAYIVGGCVRDVLKGDAPNDWDIATSASPEEMKRIIPYASYDTGIEHGTITFHGEDGNDYEVTTFRCDGEYSDGRHPDSISFANTIEEDLARRDFTVNAMAWNEKTGLVDPYNGYADLEHSLIRAVGDPRSRLEEDGLRIMRAIRFCAVKDMDMEEKTSKAIHSCSRLLDKISWERKRSEFMKIMAAANLHHTAGLIDEYRDIIGEVLPELVPTYHYNQNNPHHSLDLWHHCLKTFEMIDNEDPLVRFAALMHDVGKIEAANPPDDNGIIRYYGHMETGAVLMEQACSRLKMSNSDRKRAVFLVANHDFRPYPSPKGARRFIARCGDDEKLMDDLLSLMRSDILAHAPESAEHAMRRFEEALEHIEKEKKKNNAFTIKSLAIGGNDLMGIGMEPGPLMGKCLDAILDAVVEGDVENEREALLELARFWMSGTR